MLVSRTAAPFILLAASALLGMAAVRPAHGQRSVIVGAGDGGNSAPFGSPAGGAVAYQGEYQQVYSASALAPLGAGPFTITSLAFQSLTDGALQYNATITLSYTSATPATLSANYAANKGASPQSFAVPASFTALYNGTFDLVLPTNYLYDPSKGNLLLDVNIASETGNGGFPVFFVAGNSGDTNRVYNHGGDGVVTVGNLGASFGLQTRFTASPAPEPSVDTGIIAGALALVGLALRARQKVHSVSISPPD